MSSSPQRMQGIEQGGGSGGGGGGGSHGRSTRARVQRWLLYGVAMLMLASSLRYLLLHASPKGLLKPALRQPNGRQGDLGFTINGALGTLHTPSRHYNNSSNTWLTVRITHPTSRQGSQHRWCHHCGIHLPSDSSSAGCSSHTGGCSTA